MKEKLLDEYDDSFLERNSISSSKFKLSWKGISYFVKLSKKEQKRLNLVGTEEKQILRDVEGFAVNGQTLYIMGASGAGKTTLLNVLCDRIKNDQKN